MIHQLKAALRFIYDVRGLIQWGGLTMVCAIAGDQSGYAIGYKAGMARYDREDSFFFREKHLIRTHEFYEKHGAKTIVLARFVPIVRTFAPVVAGIATMRYRRFVSYDVIGGALWVLGMVLTGYSLASLIPNVEKRIHEVIVVVIFLSILPAIIKVYRERRRRKIATA